MKTESKICLHCGLRFSWRKKWERSWSQVKYCSERCRKRSKNSLGQHIEDTILGLLATRKGSICPSEAARAMRAEGWRELMPEVHAASRRMAHRGTLDITQKGQAIDPDMLRGPVRLSLKSPPE